MNIKPTGTSMVIKRIMAQRTKGGIYIPRSAKKEAVAQSGQILAVGPDVTMYSSGDYVMFTKFQGATLDLVDTSDEFGFKFTGDKLAEYLFLQEGDVMAKLNEFVKEKGYKGE